MDFGASTLVDMKIYMIFLLLDPSLDFSTMVTKDNDSMICNWVKACRRDILMVDKYDFSIG
jgi:hypothetical protein